MDLAQRTLIGMAIGIFIVSIPISFSDLSQLNASHLIVATIFLLSIMMMYQFWGNRFLDTLSKILNGFGG
ncbi:hypothetical protein RIF25_01330 [Thermosynechococcaceae cyanobacterium BACA0444]|uniref:Uncharacterized protein n=1 Tax=Pseudocalidococcus azoricus BACA0444 TaxID=2918990 RepID=A0AAE4JWZ3_9CYAN|nr:hypothetical protein [Pseudocalidococcus azoricus]MDS3859439.1 hypothetical protein [Pseudocalidococcus azoricus BACA0444]